MNGFKLLLIDKRKLSQLNKVLIFINLVTLLILLFAPLESITIAPFFHRLLNHFGFGVVLTFFILFPLVGKEEFVDKIISFIVVGYGMIFFSGLVRLYSLEFTYVTVKRHLWLAITVYCMLIIGDFLRLRNTRMRVIISLLGVLSTFLLGIEGAKIFKGENFYPF